MMSNAVLEPFTHLVDGPVVNLATLPQSDPAASLTGTLRSDAPPLMSTSLAHVLATWRSAAERRPNAPKMSVDEGMFVKSRREGHA